MWNGRPTDIVWFNGEEYELIACDNGENLLCSGNFVNKKRNEYIGICLGYIPIVWKRNCYMGISHMIKMKSMSAN